ncbi:hypothetical protein CBW65_10080 [Tumebacillus avium]|uniref:Uncharacterized protein n=1 Tax=Tumebacillus avium TaxID=1903704 RepID=A0A1Y0IPP9_9BACL|nr:hypothetical protein [Tumebacillus avium]ARU61304.1 hypothetical protein CBW65_10080 [Tumebacillus avium]
MNKTLKRLAMLGAVAAVTLSPLSVSAAQDKQYDPWLDKSVLHYLTNSADAKLLHDVEELQAAVGLTDAEVSALRGIANEEYSGLMHLKGMSDVYVKDKSLKHEEKVKKVEAMNYNGRHNAILAQTDAKVHALLGGRYKAFRDYINSWWAEDVKFRHAEKRGQINQQEYGYNGLLPEARAVSTVYSWATQYNPNTAGKVEVALPDKQLKFANLGWATTYTNPPYTVTVKNESNGTIRSGLRVDEVGPWNQDDNYWDANPRRIYSMLKYTSAWLDPGFEEAYMAYTENYNSGYDQFNRKVANKAGIDMSIEAAKLLGFSYLQNGWVTTTVTDLP